MRTPSRIRRILKWVGLAACASVLVAMTVSGWWAVGYWHYTKSQAIYPWLMGGHVGYTAQYATVTQTGQLVPNGTGGWVRWPVPGLYIERQSHGWPLLERNWLPQLSSASTPHRAYSFALPLWLVFLLAFVPTACLWYRDARRWYCHWRRFPPGHCARCGYDLTGNTSGVCSECGLKLAT